MRAGSGELGHTRVKDHLLLPVVHGSPVVITDTTEKGEKVVKSIAGAAL